MRGSSTRLRRLCVGAIAAVGLALLPAGASAAPITIDTTATDSFGLPFNYKIEVPAAWNGTLVLYSHGYSFGPPFGAAAPQAAEDGPNAAVKGWLLANGYAIAGSSYSTTGWALQQAFVDQMQVLKLFDDLGVGHPTRTIAWGQSLGGMITAGLIQLAPDRFTAALPMCGVLAGGPGVWNQGLDSEFAFLNLQAPGAFKLAGFTSFSDVSANYNAAITAFNAAQGTPKGRAHIALSAALADVPGWFTPGSSEPAGANKFAAQEVNQLAWDNNPDLFFGFFGRAELEARAGGNFSWNTGVDYRVQLSHSVDRAEVQALYEEAGLDLNAELDRLNAAPRIAITNPNALAYISRYITYNGSLSMPVLTLHTTGDGLVEVTDENAYAAVVRSAGDNSMLRQVFVHRAGHCAFTPAEIISAFQTLTHRLDTGRWEDSTNPESMNSLAASLGSTFNAAPPSFIDFHPDKFLRPFDARDVAG